MKENREPLRVYVAVDPAKILRCMWCGIALSEDWRHTEYGIYYSKGRYATYCSRGCHDAGRVNERILGSLSIVFMSAIILPSVQLSPGAFIIVVAVAVLVSCPFLYYAKVGRDLQKKVPRNSRRDDVSSDIALLKAISSGVSCPICNANIDVRKIGTDRVYNCDYCGASGTVEIVKTH